MSRCAINNPEDCPPAWCICGEQSCPRVGCARKAGDCSHVECPRRRTLTAAPSDLSGRWHFPDEDARRWPGPRE